MAAAKEAAASVIQRAVLQAQIDRDDRDDLYREIVRQADTREKREALNKLAELLKQA